MKVLVILTVAVSCQAQWVIPYTGPMEQRVEDAAGNTGFAYFDWNQNRQESRLKDGRVYGQYSYIDSNGEPMVTYYDAGPQGFRVRSNNLPVAPSPLLEAPKPVEETPEVAEARRVLEELHKKASGRAKRQVSPDWVYPIKTSTYPLYSNNPYFINPFVSPYSTILSNPWIQTKFDNAVEKTRRRREADPFLATVYTMPILPKAKFETKQFTPVEERTPADTTKLKVTTIERELPLPTVPVMRTIGWQKGTPISPITYSLTKPVIIPRPFF